MTKYADIPHNGRVADVCLVLEGSYPYVTGGVSSWAHSLLLAQQDLTFHLVCLLPAHGDMEVRYELPGNVISLTNILIDKPRRGPKSNRRFANPKPKRGANSKRRLGDPVPARSANSNRRIGDTKPRRGAKSIRRVGELLRRLEQPVSRVLAGGGLSDIGDLIDALTSARAHTGEEILLNHPAAWDMMLRMYGEGFSETSLLEYFWTWRTVLGGLYAVLLADLPAARLYHPLSTGYAGLYAARARLVTGRPVLLTEHGIYTNERRIELATADWLHETPGRGLSLQARRGDLRDMWINCFVTYSRACYEASSEIVTLYAGNQVFQSVDGAPSDKLTIIPNGIDFERFSAVERTQGERLPTIALIGRVVPIKDVKTFIRACAILRQRIPEFRALVIGPTDEDEKYFEQCKAMVESLDLADRVVFTGPVIVEEHLGSIDVLVLTSMSEAQPLVILEAGAVGVPAVVTDVGACREMLLGRTDEQPAFGPGGTVTPLANPQATALAVTHLLTDSDWRESCGSNLRERVRCAYNKRDLDTTYDHLYHKYRDAPDGAEELRWRA